MDVSNIREDGTYHINNVHGGLDNSGVYYDGTYSLQGDSIILDKSINLADNSFGSVSMSKEWILKGNSIMFYTFFPYENVIFEDSLYWIIKQK